MINGFETRIKSFDLVDLYLNIYETGQDRWLIVNHGIAEHLGRYQFLTDLMAQEYNILFYDLRGHGRSGGKKGYINDFYDFSKDLFQILLYLYKEFSLERYNIFGHSMGGLITCDFVHCLSQLIRENDAQKMIMAPEKIFIASVPVSPGGLYSSIYNLTSSRFLKLMADFKYSVAMEKFDNSDLLSHDPRVGLDYAEDELVIKKLHSKLIFQIGYRAKELFKRPLNYSGQLYCAVGSQDQIIAPKKFENYIKKFMPEAEFKTFRDGKHELHHEILRIRNPYFKYLKLSLS